MLERNWQTLMINVMHYSLVVQATYFVIAIPNLVTNQITIVDAIFWSFVKINIYFS